MDILCASVPAERDSLLGRPRSRHMVMEDNRRAQPLLLREGFSLLELRWRTAARMSPSTLAGLNQLDCVALPPSATVIPPICQLNCTAFSRSPSLKEARIFLGSMG